MKSADVEKCHGVKRYRMLGNRKQIYIYIYTFAIVGEALKSIFHRGKDFYRGQGFFEFTSANFFDREREHFLLFLAFKLEKRRKLRFLDSVRKIVLIILLSIVPSSVYFEGSWRERVGLVLSSGNKISENDIFSVKFDSHLSEFYRG